jgi:hypothetical protein
MASSSVKLLLKSRTVPVLVGVVETVEVTVLV